MTKRRSDVCNLRNVSAQQVAYFLDCKALITDAVLFLNLKRLLSAHIKTGNWKIIIYFIKLYKRLRFSIVCVYNVKDNSDVFLID